MQIRAEAISYGKEIKDKYFQAQMRTSGRLTVLRNSYALCMSKMSDIRQQKSVLQRRAGEIRLG